MTSQRDHVLKPQSQVKRTVPEHLRDLLGSEDWNHVSPDDLFVRFTVPEVRNIQAKLRTEADAKQEELRLMVGERYRELLQASTSIISIADSSKRVIEAFSEMGHAMNQDGNDRKPQRSSIRDKDDVHLKKLQSLSAHLKLLLDSPEHLWRLLEEKKHLPAAWLFLLARVVHRALVKDDAEEDWGQEGINVLAQFPLVRRQWDTISQFRSQIVHRAAQHLREPAISSEIACSTLLTLHLLDSLPLSETLSIFLSQRTRTLNALLSRDPTVGLPPRAVSSYVQSRLKNHEDNHPQLKPPSPATRRKGATVAKSVRIAIFDLLDVIGRTLSIAENVFGEQGDEKPLVERALISIQEDTSSDSNPVITTRSVLSTLPSSTHLLMLPQSILSYKPYIDLTSSSTRVDPATLHAKLAAWFDKALHSFEERIRAWFEGLETIQAVWEVRHKVLKSLRKTRSIGGERKEKIQALFDGQVKRRIGEVTRIALKNIEGAVDDILKSSVQAVRDGIEETRLDASPTRYLFSPLSVPTVSHLTASSNSAVTSFENFKKEVRKRADVRTPSLDKALNEIESKAGELKEDLKVITKGDETDGELQQQIMNDHYPVARLSLNKIIDILQGLISSECSTVEEISEKSIITIVFLGRVSHNLASSSLGDGLLAGGEALNGFRDKLEALHERSLVLWRGHAISTALKIYTPLSSATKDMRTDQTEFAWPSQPTPNLVMSLLSLVSSLQQLCLPQADLYSKGVATSLMNDFKVSLANEFSVEDFKKPEQAQLLWDFALIRRISPVHVEPSDKSTEREDILSTRVASLRSWLGASMDDDARAKFNDQIDRTVETFLLRCQTYLGPLAGACLPLTDKHVNGNAVGHGKGSKTGTLLVYGAPSADQDFKPAIGVAKTSARFGLLLVGSTAV